jgi:23S rRNA (uracil1939-C5)-methyltransferase
VTDLSQRVDCPHAAACGSCGLIGETLGVQLALKRGRVRRALARYGRLAEIEVEAVRAAAQVVRYRTRAKLVVSPAGAIGLYAPGTHAVVDLPECQVWAPGVAAVAARLRTRLKAEAAALGLHGVDLREVAGVAPEEVAGVLVTLIAGAGAPQPGVHGLAAQIATWPEVRGVAVSQRAADSPQLLGRDLRVLHGPEEVRDAIGPGTGEPWYYATHGSFVQAHRAQAQAIYAHVIATLADAWGELRGVRVLELYAGSGALGLRLAMRGARVTLVESHAPAAALAARAARDQALDVEVRCDDAATALHALLEADARFDAVLVNPPRHGLQPAVRRSLVALRPRLLAYVSCDPVTLARDLHDLTWGGLRVDRLSPFDMIPLSADVETAAVLVPGTTAVPALRYEDAEILIVDKPPHLPTTPHGEYPHSLLSLVRAGYGLPEATPVHRLDAGTSGLCIFARTPRLVAPWAARLARSDKQYLALVRGVPHAKGSIRRPLQERGRKLAATTRYRRLELIGGHALLRVMPEQGRMHQIRRHLAALGHPVLGDTRYGDARSNLHFERKHGLDRTFLHCSRLALSLDTGEQRVIEAPLAPDLEAVLEARTRDYDSGV